MKYLLVLLLLAGCTSTQTKPYVEPAIKAGMSCWVERERPPYSDESSVYCGDASLAPINTPYFVRWIKEQ